MQVAPQPFTDIKAVVPWRQRVNGPKQTCDTLAIKSVTNVGRKVIDDKAAQFRIEVAWHWREVCCTRRLQNTPFRLAIETVQVRVDTVDTHHELRPGLYQESMVAVPAGQG